MNFIIQKLKNKHIFLKKLPNWAKLSSLVLREREETKTKYFAPKYVVSFTVHFKKNVPIQNFKYLIIFEELKKNFINLVSWGDYPI